MHELGIMETVLDTALEFAKDNNATEIKEIHLLTGIIFGIHQEYAELFFRMVSKDTIAQNAKIVFESVPACFICTECKGKTEYPAFSEKEFYCKHCGSKKVTMVSGREFRIQNMVVV
ncbi:MAG: hydrogenase maturation nickel metallochaperone HypA [Coriobacteriales bacterium]|jgi:hydrogenase nickel incorporation protein HypA/HybF|nr:hydrogenase maturation nickel metallochaperone HypA [Coriobacteriales bacterium]